MATTVASRHHAYATPPKTLPITMPSKAPVHNYPVRGIPMSPPELSETSTLGGGRSSARSYSALSSEYAASHSGSDYDSYNSQSGVDIVDMLSDRMNAAFDPMRMDKSLARQAQT